MIRTQTREGCGHTPGARVHISGKSRGASSLECKPAHTLITHLVKIEKATAFFTPAAFSGYITDLIKKETGSDYFNSIIFFTLVKLPAERR